MTNPRITRRKFAKTSAAIAATGLTAPYWFTGAAHAERIGEHLRFGVVGVNNRGFSLLQAACNRGAQLQAIADVDSDVAARRRQESGGTAETYGDYRRLLDRKDVDLVFIATPDHWHAKIAIEAMQAGKDVYCEKPLTLTIDEGKLIRRVVKETGRVFQVGTQQRSEDGPFKTAVALCHLGRLGTIERCTCAVGGSDKGGPFQPQDPPANLDWDFWLGQAPKVPYMRERCHANFRCWYDYSGGQLTDWGAHHVDIAHWALGAGDTGPIKVEGTGLHQNIPNGYDAAISFNVKCTFQSGVELIIEDIDPRFKNGILIEGSKGRLFVNRRTLTGVPVDALKDDPLPEGTLAKLYKGKQMVDHTHNFFECVKDRSEPISDVASHHRALTTCHLANIAIRLGRPLAWDPDSEQIVGDDEANRWQKREQRAPYQIHV